MVSLRLVFGWRVPLRTRVMAAANVFFCVYFTVLTLLVTMVCWSEILPGIYMADKDRIRRHKLFICFVFLNAWGNFILCVVTDTSIKRVGMGILERFTKTITIAAARRRNSRIRKVDGSLNITEINNAFNQSEKSKDDKKSKTKHETTKSRKGKQILETKDQDKQKQKVTDLSHNKEVEWGADSPVKCLKCEVFVPRRSHHCVLCQTCILKRDHHCFFMTVCVGYFNQKYFVMYCFYMMIGTFYGMFLIVLYLKQLYEVTFYGPQTYLILFIDILGKLYSNTGIEPGYLCLLFLMYACLSAGLMAAGLWFWQLQIILAGQTTHEATSIGGMKGLKSKLDNIIDVFGKYWILTFMLPLPLPQPQSGESFVEKMKWEGQ